jgi:hypothetical protein
MRVQARNIDEVITLLDYIVKQSCEENSPAGLFAALYRQVTLRVREHIHAQDLFEDNERMEMFDTVFANRYFAAWDAWRNGAPTTQAWQHTFDQIDRPDVMFIQHLMLGMNAHINLDLGIAAAEVCRQRSEAIGGLRSDFEHVNSILKSLLEDSQAVLNDHSPAMRVVDIGLIKFDEIFGLLSLKKMRMDAWNQAKVLRDLPVSQRLGAMRLVDSNVTELAQCISRPAVLTPVLHWLSRYESSPVANVIEELNVVSSGGSGRRYFREIRELISSAAFATIGLFVRSAAVTQPAPSLTVAGVDVLPKRTAAPAVPAPAVASTLVGNAVANSRS